MLDDVAIIHMNGRVYDPFIGRFLQADPYMQDPTNTQNFNRYSYVWNNPPNATDPSGYFSFWDVVNFSLWGTVPNFAIDALSVYRGISSPSINARINLTGGEP
jgi:RHS repeat-associated protein